MNRRSLLKLFSAIPGAYVAHKAGLLSWEKADAEAIEKYATTSGPDEYAALGGFYPNPWRLFINGQEAGSLLSVGGSGHHSQEIRAYEGGVWLGGPSKSTDVELEFIPTAGVIPKIGGRAVVMITDGELNLQFNALVMGGAQRASPDGPGTAVINLYADGVEFTEGST